MKRGIALVLIALLCAAIVFAWWVLRDQEAPQIAQGLSCEDLRHCGKANTDFDAIIRQQFPAGTTSDALEGELSAQGFHRDPKQPKICTPRGANGPIGVLSVECPSWDGHWNPYNSLVYRWGRFPCGNQAAVMWSADRNGRVTHTEGYLSYACL
jgi:hypothetical protein